MDTIKSTVTIYLPVELVMWLKEQAKEKQSSVNSVIVKLIETAKEEK